MCQWERSGEIVFTAWAKFGRVRHIQTDVCASYAQAREELEAKASKKGLELFFFDGVKVLS